MRQKPVEPVAPEGMEIVFFYPCPQCGRHVPMTSPTEARLISCDSCRCSFPIIPVDEHTVQFMRIMLAGGQAAGDPDFL